MKKMRGVIYARYSPGPDQTERSIEGQVADCQAYADRNDIDIISVYADRHVSGRSLKGRLEFQRMIKDAEKGLFDCVVTWKVDRFGRDRYDIANNKMKLKRTGVKLLYSKESIPEGPEGIILESVLEGLAEYYSADLAQKISRGYRENAKKGVWTFPLPLGYTRDEHKHVVPDPVVAPLIRRCFELYAAGTKEKELVEWLRSQGVTGQRGKPIGNGVVYRILRSRRYLGEFEIQGVKYEGIEPLVPVELFEQVQTMFPTSRNNAAGRAKVSYLLSCKCFCGYCGTMMSGESGTGKSGKLYSYYKCGKKKRGGSCELKPVKREILETAVLQHTMTDMLTDEIIDRLVAKILEIQEQDDDQSVAAALRSRLEGTRKKIENVLDAIENGGGSALVSRLSALEEQRDELEAELARVEIKTPRLTADAIRAWLCSFRKGDISDEGFCRRLIDTFVDRVEVREGEALIIYNATKEGAASRCSSTAQLVDYSRLYSNTLPFHRPVVTSHFILLRIAV